MMTNHIYQKMNEKQIWPNSRDDETRKTKCLSKPVKECRVVESENSNFARVDSFQDVICKFDQCYFGEMEFAVSRLKRTETEKRIHEGKGVQAKSRSKLLPIV